MAGVWLVTFAVLLVVSDHSDGQDVRVKLCGREFIRMVVTSCGSSRLRRSALDFTIKHISADARLMDSGQMMTQVQNTENLRSIQRQNQELVEVRRTARDVGPAGICCRSGCTLSELIQYC
ncbi:relaxin-3-like [Hoplias malabaricus]|uniref:relaxin-3-like n=1 Tax=Hoplias malabaricus TaxID=27720 RepID=UPI003463223A